MTKDQFGNDLGVDANGTTTFNGQTMADYVASGGLPNGYYQDPEGTIRAKEGTVDASGTFVGTNGTRGFFGSQHSLADFVDGVIVSFHGGGATPAGGGGAIPGAPYNPLAKAGAAFDAGAAAKTAIDALVALASK